MIKYRIKRIALITVLLVSLVTMLMACGTKKDTVEEANVETTAAENVDATASEDEDVATGDEETPSEDEEAAVEDEKTTSTEESNIEIITTTANVTSTGVIDATDIFTDRDLEQTVDTSGATKYELTSGEDINITAEGIYVVSGEAEDVTITVDAGDNDKVQIVLDGAKISNTDFPAIYVKNADKVFVTTTDSENLLEVTGTFVADGTTNTDAAIFSKDDLILNGIGTLEVNSTDNGITGKDDVKVTGGTIKINSTSDAIEANETIAVADGNITISTSKDGLHAENSEDDTTGYIYICGGTISVEAGDDAIQGTTVVQIDGGDFDLSGVEGIEATYIQINDGNINVYASDDGINASAKSTAYTMTVEINGGNTAVEVGQGDTDAIDSNGYIYVNGGTLDITAQSPFDYDMGAEYRGGTLIINGTETTEISNQMMGGMHGGPGGMGGGPSGGFGGGFGGPMG